MNACEYYDNRKSNLGLYLNELLKETAIAIYGTIEPLLSDNTKKSIKEIGSYIDSIDKHVFYYTDQIEKAVVLTGTLSLMPLATGCGGGGSSILTPANEITTRQQAIDHTKSALNSRAGNVSTTEHSETFPNQHGGSYRIMVFDFYGPGNSFQHSYVAVGPVGVEERATIAWLNDPDNNPSTPVPAGNPIILLVPIETYAGDETIDGFKTDRISDAIDLETLTARDIVN